ncbi:nucleotidyltransferase family protein [Heyndrickxia sp. NPDC080065]|uniref:nucleotidyltransferase family protein n=1 Tax=Heyndrickxia sp. NPDC080065 TaxID=3390568 RepID=UPI003D02823C
MIKTEEDIIQMIKEDQWMMDILRAAKTLHLPDWWVCAGFVRSKIWDMLHGFHKRTPLQDVDVIYYDPSLLDEKVEKNLENKLKNLLPNVPWSVKNEARMHVVNHIPPYTSAVDAICKFPETATALGVKLNDADQIVLTAPCGLEDVLNMRVRPTPFFSEDKDQATIYKERILKKNWKAIWDQVDIQHIR